MAKRQPAKAATSAITASEPDSEPAAPAVSGLPGVDVSSFQGPPGTWHAEAGAARWVGIKITELQPNLRYVNPDAAADWAYVGKRKALGRIAYLFGHPSVSAAESVAFFTSEVKSLGLLDTDGIMLDLETTDGLGPAAVSAWAVEVMASLHTSFKRMPILYTFLSFGQEGNTAGLGKYPLWISDPSSPEGHPRIPPPWTTWTIHQYSTSGAIDRDLADFRSVAAMREAFGVAPTPPAPPKPHTGNLGGSVTGAVTAIRWGDGSMLIAGLDDLNHVQIKRFDGGSGKWGVWWNPAGTTKAAGPPGLVSWGASFGQLFYATETGDVIEMATEDTGRSWK